MKAKQCEDAKQRRPHKPHPFSTEHGDRHCKGYISQRVRYRKVPEDE